MYFIFMSCALDFEPRLSFLACRKYLVILTRTDLIIWLKYYEGILMFFYITLYLIIPSLHIEISHNWELLIDIFISVIQSVSINLKVYFSQVEFNTFLIWKYLRQNYIYDHYVAIWEEVTHWHFKWFIILLHIFT